MAEREPSALDTTAPYVTLRQAVRPVVVAHRILSNEQLAAGALAEEAKNLCDLTEELLRKLGRARLLTASAAVVGDLPKGAMADRAIEAYARAGMAWTEVLDSVTRLAELLIDEGDWTTSGLLARIVADAGETAIAQHIDKAISKAQPTKFVAQVAEIHTQRCMSPTQIRNAIAKLSSLPEHPDRASIIRSRRQHLIQSTLAVAKKRNVNDAILLLTDMSRRAEALGLNQRLEKSPYYELSESRLFSDILAALNMCGV